MATITISGNQARIDFTAEEITALTANGSIQLAAALNKLINEKTRTYRRSRINSKVAIIANAAEVDSSIRSDFMALATRAEVIVKG